MRSGIGYDVHRFGEGGRLVLGGVEFEGEPGLAGHSDADVVAHAVTDAVLGAAGRGDIGEHFPDVDAAFAGADSVELLGRVAGELEGWRVGNVDVTVIAERPRLGPHKAEMARRLAGALGVDAACVNVKATTNEGMGFIGRGEGIAAIAVAQLERDS
jgi:2-C-methyl-D-erythritol 4-phosphate cytidylyltransferase/2-C-methyl-D-erythritol 2,4-cyclodiphosphate synthase